MNIDISGLDKASVLAALFNGSRPQGLGFLAGAADKIMSKDEAKAILDDGRAYFDYLQGRVMKVDLSGDSFSPRNYDRDNGEGAAHTVIRSLRNEGSENAEAIQLLHDHGLKNAANDLAEWPEGDDAIELARVVSSQYVS